MTATIKNPLIVRASAKLRAEVQEGRANSKAKTKPPSKVEANPELKTWRRLKSDKSVADELGQRMRIVREGKGLSLAKVSELSGVPGASLSRIENSKMSPTAGVLARIMMALDVDWIDLVGPKRRNPGDPLMSFAEPGDGKVTKVRGCRCVVLHSDASARTETLLIDVDTQELDEIGGMVGHRGEELCYVLSGTLALHFEGQPRRILKAGASAQFDSNIPHGYVAATAAGARILLVVTRAYGVSAEEGVIT